MVRTLIPLLLLLLVRRDSFLSLSLFTRLAFFLALGHFFFSTLSCPLHAILFPLSRNKLCVFFCSCKQTIRFQPYQFGREVEKKRKGLLQEGKEKEEKLKGMKERSFGTHIKVILLQHQHSKYTLIATTATRQQHSLYNAQLGNSRKTTKKQQKKAKKKQEKKRAKPTNTKNSMKKTQKTKKTQMEKKQQKRHQKQHEKEKSY
jgi:hypothetical protein